LVRSTKIHKPGAASAISKKVKTRFHYLAPDNLKGLCFVLLALVFLLRSPSLAADEIVTMDVCRPAKEHPRHDHQLIFPLQDGRLMLVWCEYYLTKTTPGGAQRDDRPCRISARISQDGGRTWAEKFVLQENTGVLNVKHPNLLRLPSGEVLLFYTEWNSHTERIIWLRRSLDDCKTWSEPTRISLLAGINNINNDHVLRMRSGRIVLPAFNSPSVWDKGDHWKAFCYYSDDEGRSWQVSERQMDLPMRGAEEPMMVERKDGSLLCFLRTSLGAIYRSESADGGTLLKRIPATGDLVLVWNHNYQKNHHHQGERMPLSTAISRDDGTTWENIKDLESVPRGAAAYASIFFREDEALVCYYYQVTGFGGASGIRVKRVPLKWFYE
jgi:sialidase-1